MYAACCVAQLSGNRTAFRRLHQHRYRVFCADSIKRQGIAIFKFLSMLLISLDPDDFLYPVGLCCNRIVNFTAAELF
jgi:hypothetical protein